MMTAVFTRLWHPYLEKALQRSEHGLPTTFMEGKRWVKPSIEVNDKKRVVEVYFSPVDGNGLVTHVAQLKDIVVDPHKNMPRIEKLLEAAIEDDLRKDLNGVGTVYQIQHVQRVKPTPMTELIKLSNNEPIDPRFMRSYCLVCPRTFDKE